MPVLPELITRCLARVTSDFPWRRYIRNAPATEERALDLLYEGRVRVRTRRSPSTRLVEVLAAELSFVAALHDDDGVVKYTVQYPASLDASMRAPQAYHTLGLLVASAIVRCENLCRAEPLTMSRFAVAAVHLADNLPHAESVRMVIAYHATANAFADAGDDATTPLVALHVGWMAVLTERYYGDSPQAAKLFSLAYVFASDPEARRQLAVRAALAHVGARNCEGAERWVLLALQCAHSWPEREQCFCLLLGLYSHLNEMDLMSRLMFGGTLPSSFADCRTVAALRDVVRAIPLESTVPRRWPMDFRTTACVDCVEKWASASLMQFQAMSDKAGVALDPRATPGAPQPLEPPEPEPDSKPSGIRALPKRARAETLSVPPPPPPTPRRPAKKTREARPRTGDKEASIARVAAHERALRERERARVEEVERRMELVRLGDAIGRG